MSRQRHAPVFTVATPYPGAPEVTLWENTWTEKIQSFHPDMIGQEGRVQAVLANPATVTTATDPRYVMFVSQVDSYVDGAALVVCVNPVHDSGKPSVTSAHQTKQKKFLSPDPATILWP